MDSSKQESTTVFRALEIHFRNVSLPVIVLNVADHVNDVREQTPDVLVRKAATRFTLKNFGVCQLLGLELGRGISNLDKKARITRPAPLI